MGSSRLRTIHPVVRMGLPLLLALAASQVVVANDQPGGDSCLECHGRTNARLVFQDGSTRPVVVDKELWENSIHGQLLKCNECHENSMNKAHPKAKSGLKYKNQRDYVAQVSESCQRCHYSYYTRALDSIHYELRNAGKQSAPACGDCHKPHSMTNPRTPRAEISRRCGACHEQVYAAYKTSVHGRALEESDNKDVPVCTDCHTAHSIMDPRTPQFHAASYTLCAKCHSDETKMRRNDLNTAAFTTYLDDFHGKSNRLYNNGTKPPEKIVAVCTDCHGVHDMASLRGANKTESREQIRKRLVTTCRKCHTEVAATFADAWLSHYPPRMETAPVLTVLKRFYGVFNPFLIGLFVVNILLNLWMRSVRANLEQFI